MREINQISEDVLDVALRLHRDLGPGLLESVYETVLAGKLAALGYSVLRQRSVDIEFEGLVSRQLFGSTCSSMSGFWSISNPLSGSVPLTPNNF